MSRLRRWMVNLYLFLCVFAYLCVVSLAALQFRLPVCAASLHTKQKPWDRNCKAFLFAERNTYVTCNLTPVSSNFPQHVFSACVLSVTFETSAHKSFHLFIKCVSIQNWRIWKFSSEFTTTFLMGALFSVSTADESQRSQQTSQSCLVSSVGTNRRVDLLLPPDGRWLAVCVF